MDATKAGHEAALLKLIGRNNNRINSSYASKSRLLVGNTVQNDRPLFIFLKNGENRRPSKTRNKGWKPVMVAFDMQKR